MLKMRISTFTVAVLLLSAIVVQAQDNVNPIRNITVSAGEDIHLVWDHKDPTFVSWTKEDVSVEATDAFREGRTFIMPEQGLLILNSEWDDRGHYISVVITNQQKVLEQVFRVDVAPPDDLDLNSGGFPCGYPRVRGKIVGGKIAEHGQSPWTALLWDKAKSKPFCGGVLLNRRWVLTAAHCFSLSEFDNSNKDLFEIRLGEYDTRENDGSEIHLRVETIITNPSYDRQTYDSDIALLKLRQPVTYTDYILPLCLPSEMRAQELIRSGKNGFVTGWGNTAEEGHYSRYLRRVRLTIVNQQTCGSMHSHIITNNMFCAASNLQKDACQGDSGGPFVIKDSQRWYLVGLVSWGIGCANPQFPGVYSRVHRFRQWIEELIQDDMETCEESQFELREDLTQKKRRINVLERNVVSQVSRISELEGQLQEKDNQLQSALAQNCSSQHTTCITTTQTLTTTTPQPTTTTRTTTLPLTLPTTPLPVLPSVQVRCRGDSCWHVGGYRVYASCLNGYCVCDSPDYDRDSCLPSVGSCEIHQNPNPAAAHASYLGVEKETYKCVTHEPGRQSIHILSVYEGSSHTRPASAGDMNVVLETESPSNKPVVLILVSYEPVRWILDVPDVVVIDQIVLVSYYLDESSVDWLGTVRDVPTIGSSRIPRGYGSDSGGGNTAGLLKYIRDNYGPVNSFTGTYRADTWNLDISHGNTPHSFHPQSPPQGGTSTNPAVPLVTINAWTLYSFTYDNNWNACNGQQYVRRTTYGTGLYVGVVLCSPTRYKIFLSDSLRNTFRNVADSSGHGQDHCELVGAAQNDPQTIDSNFWSSPSIVGYSRSNWGEQFELGYIGGGIGGSWTGKFYVKWYECGVTIP